MSVVAAIGNMLQRMCALSGYDGPIVFKCDREAVISSQDCPDDATFLTPGTFLCPYGQCLHLLQRAEACEIITQVSQTPAADDYRPATISMLSIWKPKAAEGLSPVPVMQRLHIATSSARISRRFVLYIFPQYDQKCKIYCSHIAFSLLRLSHLSSV